MLHHHHLFLFRTRRVASSRENPHPNLLFLQVLWYLVLVFSFPSALCVP